MFSMYRFTLAAVTACFVAGASAQISQLITSFETDGTGDPLQNQNPAGGSLDDLAVVMFQDPAEADVTTANIVPDDAATLNDNDNPDTTADGFFLTASEESFVANFNVGAFDVDFFGANSTDQFLDIRFEWVDPTNPDRWALIETLQSPTLGDPSIHLDGKVRLYVNFPNCVGFEFSGLSIPSEIGVALLISETGLDLPLGFQDSAVLGGNFEFVGVSSVVGADTENPVPVPSTFIPITDTDCSGSTTGPSGDWRLLEFDLSTANVIGWSARGGDGVLDATALGDGVNRGTLAGLVLTVPTSDTSSDYIEFLVDEITFEAPVAEPPIAPVIAGPIVQGDTAVQVEQVVPRASSVVLEIDLADADNEDPFTADDSIAIGPGLSTTGEDRFVLFEALDPPLAAGDRLRAYQMVNGVMSADSAIVTVNPPSAFLATLALDEDGNLGAAPADFEYVGATSVQGAAAPQGKPVFPENGVWQRLEFSLIPGVEPIISFAGGDGRLEPDGGLYNIDSMFFTIDPTEPNIGPYEIFIDRIYYIDANDNEVVISSAEAANPFPSERGQSTAINNASTLSTIAAFDGSSSNRHEWEFPDDSSGNAYSVFRPGVSFPDSAKAVGMWLLVEDPRESGLPLPVVEGPIVGNAPLITVSNLDPAATNVDLLVNGAVAGSVDPQGATSVDIAPTVALAVLDSVSAQYATATEDSDLALPVGVQPPFAPAVQAPLVEGQSTVVVNNVLDDANATASLVSVFIDGALAASIDPAGASTVAVTVSPALVLGEQVTATQTVNGIESDESAPVGVGTGEVTCVTINEFSYDQSGADDIEFVELYNAEDQPVDISGWTLRASNEIAPPNDPNPDYVINPGVILQPGDFYVVGLAGVPNVDQVPPGSDLWDGGVDAIELLDENGVVVDTVVYEINKGLVGISPAEGGIWGNFWYVPGGGEQAWARWFDGFDTQDNGRDFGLMPATPGESNEFPSIVPLTENFPGAAESPAANFTGSFVNVTTIDPTADSASNPGPIAASPQGGNAAICWDPAGGGNQCGLIDEARFAMSVSMFVYLDTTTSPFTAGNTSGEFENWSIGLGTVDVFYNNPAVGGGATANGNTGLMWYYRKTEDADTGNVGEVVLQLIDHNNGGAGTVLLDVPASELTTGWHELTIERNYDAYFASFNTTSASGSLPANGPSTLQMGYREFVVGVPGTLRPPTFDGLLITEPAPPVLGASCSPCGCRLLTAEMSAAFGESYAGDGTDCTDADANGVADACEALAAPKPTLTGPICTVDRLIEVGNVSESASEVRIVEDGGLVLGSIAPSGAGTVRVPLDLAPMAGGELTAIQTVGTADSSPSDPVTAEECAFTCDTVFTDDLDTDSSGLYTVVVGSADTAVTFNYDYSADGIPPAPSSDGTTIGLKMEANLTDGAVDTVSAAPTGILPAGDYIVTVEAWINFDTGTTNPPASGTTEFIGAGVAYDGATADNNGVAFIAAAEGGSGLADFRPFADNVLLLPEDGNVISQFVSYDNVDDLDLAAAFPAQPVPAGQGQTGQGFDGGLAFAWRTIELRVDRALESVTITIDDVEIGTVACGGELGVTCALDGLVRMMYSDPFGGSVSNNPQFQFGLFDNFTVAEMCELGDPTLLGDANCDGTVDFFDIDPFVTALVGGQSAWEAAFDCDYVIANDINEDGEVDFFDIDPFVALLVGS